MASTDDARDRALQSAVGNIEKQFGKGAIMRLGSDEPLVREVSAIPTGSLSLDLALGIGGLPRGRIVEIYGPESSGKTTLTLQVIAEAQKSRRYRCLHRRRARAGSAVRPQARRSTRRPADFAARYR